MGAKDLKKMRKFLQLTEQEKEQTVTSSNATVSVQEKSLSDYRDSVFKDFERSLRTLRIEKDGIY